MHEFLGYESYQRSIFTITNKLFELILNSTKIPDIKFANNSASHDVRAV